MKRQSDYLFVAVTLALLGLPAQKGRGDFILWNDESLIVNSSHNQGTLYDRSDVYIVSGGSVLSLYAYDSSQAVIDGGWVNHLYAYHSSRTYISKGYISYNLYAYDSSTVDISGGSVGGISTYDFSTTNISNGSVSSLNAYDSSIVNISGGSIFSLEARGSITVNISDGSITNLHAYDSSVIIFLGKNFRLGDGLVLDGERVLGIGILSGEWMDRTRWVVNIATNDLTATILATPNPIHILTIDVDPNDVGIDTVIPDVGPHNCGGWVSIKAERFVNCPDVYTFDHWDGDVNDPNSADTTVFMDSDKTITAVFVAGRQCGDECHPYPLGDIDKNCIVDFNDFALVALTWLECTKPECD